MIWRRDWLPTLVFYLEKFKDRGAWGVTIHGVEMSWTQLSNDTSTFKLKQNHKFYFTLHRNFQPSPQSKPKLVVGEVHRKVGEGHVSC